MKHRILFIFMLLFANLISWQLKAQDLVVESQSGNITTNALSSVKSLKFTTSDAILTLTNEATEIFAISEIKKISFENITGIDQLDASKFSFYPNPVNSVLYLRNLKSNQNQVQIYRVDGSLLQSISTEGTNTSINLGDLASGIYFLRIDNQIEKLIKL